MQPIRDVSQRNACSLDDTEGAASQSSTAYTVQKGDTLSKLAAGLPPISVTKTTTWNLDTIDRELDAGRPVVMGVDYKQGASGGNLGTDHWVCLTHRGGDPEGYFANDPATGKEIKFLKQANGKLLKVGEGEDPSKPCLSSGEFVTFRKPVQS